jgi:hypothetical protein
LIPGLVGARHHNRDLEALGGRRPHQQAAGCENCRATKEYASGSFIALPAALFGSDDRKACQENLTGKRQPYPMGRLRLPSPRITTYSLEEWQPATQPGGKRSNAVPPTQNRRLLWHSPIARIAALERLVGKLTLENEFLKGASHAAAQPRSATTSVIAGPPASPSKKDAG